MRFESVIVGSPASLWKSPQIFRILYPDSLKSQSGSVASGKRSGLLARTSLIPILLFVLFAFFALRYSEIRQQLRESLELNGVVTPPAGYMAPTLTSRRPWCFGHDADGLLLHLPALGSGH
jgi:hypothetical protein